MKQVKIQGLTHNLVIPAGKPHFVAVAEGDERVEHSGRSTHGSPANYAADGSPGDRLAQKYKNVD